MRLIISEFLTHLKEDGELDSLIAELLRSMKIVPIVKPDKGRQYGVDLSAVGVDPEDGQRKVFLFVIKQGHLNRSTWNSGVNSVRPSLDEVCDTYLPTHVPERYKKMPIKVIVATNGDLKQAVFLDWTQYTKSKSQSLSIEIDFWSIDRLTQMIEDHMFSEALFPEEYSKLLRLSLAFLENDEYDLHHFHSLIGLLLSNAVNKRDDRLRINQVNLCLNLLWNWCKDLDDLKPALKACEFALLNTWGWIQEKEYYSNKIIIRAFVRIKRTYLDIGVEYFTKLQKHFYIKHALHRSTYNFMDYTLLVWEQIGIVANIGLMHIYETEVDYIINGEVGEYGNSSFEDARTVSDGLIHLIENNPPSFNPCYDEHCIEINLALLLFYKTGQLEMAKSWVRRLIAMTGNAFKVSGNFPLFYTDELKLIESHFGESVKPTSSILLTVLSEWCVILSLEEDYNTLKEIIKHAFPDVDLQMWYPEKETEGLMYSANKKTESGTVQSTIQLPNTLSEYKEILIKEIDLFGVESEFLCITKGWHFLPYLSSRYYRIYCFPFLWRRLLRFPASPDVELDN